MSDLRILSLLLICGACGTTDPPFVGTDSGNADAAVPDMSVAQPDVLPPPTDMTVSTDLNSLDMANPNNTPMLDGPTRYLAGPVVQPVTQSVVDAMLSIRAASDSPSDDVFMKVGASGTVNRANLTCFGPTSSYQIELDGRDELQPTIDRFNSLTFVNESPWDRTTLAAEVGRSASWAQSGAPSPIDQEIAALNPRFALVNYGTNDMQLGATHATALWPFVENMQTLLSSLTTRGIVPIVTGLNPRGDTTVAANWAPTYDAATRALAESHQIPFIDLYMAAKDLPARGLISDGIHGNSYADGGSQPCVFTDAGLQYNYNVRNLATLELLHEVATTVVDGAPATLQNARPWAGSGTRAQPWVVDELVFSHHGDTSSSPSSEIDAYPACDSGQNESGPEVFYDLNLDAPTPLRIMVFDRDGVDIDVHLLQDGTCLERADRLIQGTFGAGAYTIVADTFVSTAVGPQAGQYSLVVLECEPGDPLCS